MQILQTKEPNFEDAALYNSRHWSFSQVRSHIYNTIGRLGPAHRKQSRTFNVMAWTALELTLELRLGRTLRALDFVFNFCRLECAIQLVGVVDQPRVANSSKAQLGHIKKPTALECGLAYAAKLHEGIRERFPAADSPLDELKMIDEARMEQWLLASRHYVQTWAPSVGQWSDLVARMHCEELCARAEAELRSEWRTDTPVKTIEEVMPDVCDPILTRLQAIELIKEETGRQVSISTIGRMTKHLQKFGERRQLRKSIVLKLAQEKNNSAKSKMLRRRYKK